MTQIEICNLALSWLGVDSITSLDDDLTQAKACKIVYPFAKKALLGEREWSFATHRITLTQTTDEVVEVQASQLSSPNSFLIPADCLRVLDVSNGSSPLEWQIEGDKILAKSTLITVRYLREVSESYFSASFGKALAALISSDMAMGLTESENRYTAELNRYATNLRMAINSDSMQGTHKKLQASNLTGVRR